EKGVSKFIRLQEIREKLIRRRATGPQIEVNGREEWVGWFELVVEDVTEAATMNTGRVITIVGADVLCLMEVENRTALRRLNGQVVPQVLGTPYDHAMLIDGNDERGIDVGVMYKQAFDLTNTLSHAEDTDAQGEIFSRDCPEYEFQTPL